jgi:phosphoheptose isomerase
MIDLENISPKFTQIIQSKNFKELEKKFKLVDTVYIISHGGNLSITRHLATDLTRLSKNKKKVVAPDSDTVSIWHGDYNYELWLENWLESQIRIKDKNSLVIGVTSSGASPDVIRGLNFAKSLNIDTFLISGTEVVSHHKNINLNVSQYFIGEILTIMSFYQIFKSAGFDVPKLKTLNLDKHEVRENSNSDETRQLGIDFDGVIHGNSKGFYDGTIYDDPLQGSIEAIKELSKKWDIIIYTAKAKLDRPLVQGKTGTQLVWDWLKKYDIDNYVKDVTAEKPRAVVYIDDKGYRFENWESTLQDLKKIL